MKDFTVVFYRGMWHVYTTMGTDRRAQMHHIGLKDWTSAEGATRRMETCGR